MSFSYSRWNVSLLRQILFCCIQLNPTSCSGHLLMQSCKSRVWSAKGDQLPDRQPYVSSSLQSPAHHRSVSFVVLFLSLPLYNLFFGTCFRKRLFCDFSRHNQRYKLQRWVSTTSICYTSSSHCFSIRGFPSRKTITCAFAPTSNFLLLKQSSRLFFACIFLNVSFSFFLLRFLHTLKIGWRVGKKFAILIFVHI